MIQRRLLTKLPILTVRSLRGSTRNITITLSRQDPEVVAEKQVPVVTYVADDEQQTVLTINTTKPSISALPIADVAKQAFALEKGVAERLTPTLKKFTLEGKVAVVTGYVSQIISLVLTTEVLFLLGILLPDMTCVS